MHVLRFARISTPLYVSSLRVCVCMRACMCVCGRVGECVFECVYVYACLSVCASVMCLCECVCAHACDSFVFLECKAAFIQSRMDISVCFAAWIVKTQNMSFHTEAMWISALMNEK